MVEEFLRAVYFLGRFRHGTVYFLSGCMLMVFLGLRALEGFISREHIASIMMHSVSKISLCPRQMQDGGEILSVLSC